MNPKRRRAGIGVKEPSAKQLRYLASLGYEGKPPVTRADASWQISHLLARGKDFGTMSVRGDDPKRNTHTLATERQIQILRRLGYEGPDDISSADAVRLHSYLRQTTSTPG